MKKAIKKRIKITKTGKMIRRKMGIGHNGSRKTKTQKGNRKTNPPVFESDAKAMRHQPVSI